MFGRKFHFRNIIPNDFGNTELVISWFFGFLENVPGWSYE
jgi:hypothetical protein